jgi:diketogulonate reductase-like aldo/keto reductase
MTGKSPLFTLNNGVEMPVLGLGVYQSAPDETVRAVESAINNGYRLIDTAAAYFNETQVGEGIRRSGVEHSELFVTTKLWISDYGYDSTLRAFDRSLRKLGLDHLDLYLLHWPVPTYFEATLASWKAAETLLAEGRTRAIGVCNFSEIDLQTLIDRSEVTPALNQVELHPFFAQPALREVDARLSVVTQAWSPIGGVKRYGAQEGQAVQDPLAHPTVVALAERYGKTPAQIVLRWHIEHGVAVIPKSVREVRIAENIDVFDFTLSPQDVGAIDDLDIGARGGPDPESVNNQLFSVKIED